MKQDGQTSKKMKQDCETSKEQKQDGDLSKEKKQDFVSPIDAMNVDLSDMKKDEESLPLGDEVPSSESVLKVADEFTIINEKDAAKP
jgi:hypothetical protein